MSRTISLGSQGDEERRRAEYAKHQAEAGARDTAAPTADVPPADGEGAALVMPATVEPVESVPAPEAPEPKAEKPPRKVRKRK